MGLFSPASFRHENRVARLACEASRLYSDRTPSSPIFAAREDAQDCKMKEDVASGANTQSSSSSGAATADGKADSRSQHGADASPPCSHEGKHFPSTPSSGNMSFVTAPDSEAELVMAIKRPALPSSECHEPSARHTRTRNAHEGEPAAIGPNEKEKDEQPLMTASLKSTAELTIRNPASKSDAACHLQPSTPNLAAQYYTSPDDSMSQPTRSVETDHRVRDRLRPQNGPLGRSKEDIDHGQPGSSRPSPRPVQRKSDDQTRHLDSTESKLSLYRSGSDASTIPTSPERESEESMIPENALSSKELHKEIYRERNYDDGYQALRVERARSIEQLASSNAKSPMAQPKLQGRVVGRVVAPARSASRMDASNERSSRPSVADAVARQIRSVRSAGSMRPREKPLPAPSETGLASMKNRLSQRRIQAPQAKSSSQGNNSYTVSRARCLSSDPFAAEAPTLRHDPHDPIDMHVTDASSPLHFYQPTTSQKAALRPASSLATLQPAATAHQPQRSESRQKMTLPSAKSVPKDLASARATRQYSQERSHTPMATAESSRGNASSSRLSRPVASQNSAHYHTASPSVYSFDLEDADSCSDRTMNFVDSALERREVQQIEPPSPCYPIGVPKSAHNATYTKGAAGARAINVPDSAACAPSVAHEAESLSHLWARPDRALSRFASTLKRQSWIKSSAGSSTCDATPEKSHVGTRHEPDSYTQGTEGVSATSERDPSRKSKVLMRVTQTSGQTSSTGEDAKTDQIRTSTGGEGSPVKIDAAVLEDWSGFGDAVLAASMTRSNDEKWERAMERAYEESADMDLKSGTDDNTRESRSKALLPAATAPQEVWCNTERGATPFIGPPERSPRSDLKAPYLKNSKGNVDDEEIGACRSLSLEVNPSASYEVSMRHMQTDTLVSCAASSQIQDQSNEQADCSLWPSCNDTTKGIEMQCKAFSKSQKFGKSRLYEDQPVAILDLPASNGYSRRIQSAERTQVQRSPDYLAACQSQQACSAHKRRDSVARHQDASLIDVSENNESKKLEPWCRSKQNIDAKPMNVPKRAQLPRRPSSAMALQETARTLDGEADVRGRRPSFSIVDDHEFLQALELVRTQNRNRADRGRECDTRADIDTTSGGYCRDARVKSLPSSDIRRRSNSVIESASDGPLDTTTRRPRNSTFVPPVNRNGQTRTPLELGVGKASGKIRDSALYNDEDWKREVKALFIIREIVLTERSYASHLEALLRAVEVVQRVTTLARLDDANTLTANTNSRAYNPAHMTDLLSLLPRMIAISHKLANLIDESPTAAGVGAAFCAVSVELKALFVEWSGAAKSIHDALRVSEDSAGKAPYRIGLINVAPSTHLSSSSVTSTTTRTTSSCNTPSTASCSLVDDESSLLCSSTSRLSLSREGSVLEKQVARRKSEAGNSTSNASRRRSTLPSRPVAAGPESSMAMAREHTTLRSSSLGQTAKTDSLSRKRSMTHRSRKSDSGQDFAAFMDERRRSDASAADPLPSQISSPDGLVQTMKKLSPMDIAIMPTQRIPRYLLLLRDLHSNTPASSLSCVRLHRSIVFMEGVAASCNRMSGDLGDDVTASASRSSSSSKHGRSASSSVMPQALTKPAAARAMARARSFASSGSLHNNQRASQKAAPKLPPRQTGEIPPKVSTPSRLLKRESRDILSMQPKSPSFASVFAGF